MIEALLVEANGRVTEETSGPRDVHWARPCSSGASLGVVRPFATTAGQTREFLDHHLRRAGTSEAAAEWALAAGLRPSSVPPDARARLDGVELRRLLAQLPSLLSVDQIAGELRIPSREARIRIHALHRKLGVSSRRTAAAVAYERGLLR